MSALELMTMLRMMAWCKRRLKPSDQIETFNCNVIEKLATTCTPFHEYIYCQVYRMNVEATKIAKRAADDVTAATGKEVSLFGSILNVPFSHAFRS